MDKEEAILDAAIKVFSRDGYQGATIDRIAKRARVSKGAVFFYYKSKDELVKRAALRSVPVEEISSVNRRSHDSARDLLTDFGISFLRKYEKPELRNLLLMTMSARERYRQIDLALRTVCFQEMDKMFSKVEEFADTAIPVSIRRAFFGSLLCYVVWWNDNKMNPEEYVKTLTDGILYTIMKKV
ncbi:TetR/AcrR family transcriptional regulator [Caldisphaera sp.]|uniref:TetR/AcrR family transcriptional regulator n=1 Tax=Caldisphaera sp. TaxID=2060322 RepID=UPI003D0A0650